MRVLTLIFLLHAFIAAASETPKWDACILNFQKLTASTSYQIQRAFIGQEKKVKIIEEALPSDILQCVSEGVSTISIIAHAADFSSKAQRQAPLIYFAHLNGLDREKFIDDLKRELRQKQEKDPDDSEAAQMLEELESLSSDAVIYDEPKLLMGNVWKRVLQNPGNLKQLSIVACLPSKVEAAYPEFQELRGQGITIQYQPINRFFSFIFQKEVTTLNVDWLKDSVELK